MKNAPLVIDLLAAFYTFKQQQGLTYQGLAMLLNKNLPSDRKIPISPQGTSQMERWLKTHRDNWQEPSGEIVLAIQEVLAENGVTVPLVNEK